MINGFAFKIVNLNQNSCVVQLDTCLPAGREYQISKINEIFCIYFRERN